MKNNIVEIKVCDIQIGPRHRKDMGDLQSLAQTIQDIGLLQPIGVTPQMELVFGERRLRAHQLLGWETIPATVIDIPAIALGECHENCDRKDFTPSELVAIVESLRAYKHGGDRKSDQFLNSADDRLTTEKALGQVGLKKDAYCRAKRVVDQGVPELVEAMDSGKVSVFAASELAQAEPEQQRAFLERIPIEERWTGFGIRRHLRRLKTAERLAANALKAVAMPLGGDATRIGLDQAQDGVLIIDFGGGTCDFAYMSRFKVVHSWGDMQFGGRLFDDLFFQWFLDKNPGVLETLQHNNDEYFVHWYLCQEAKEHFSRTMVGFRHRPAHKAIGNYGSLSGMALEDFLGRAKRYAPSEQFREVLRQCGESRGRLAEQNTIDLLEWFSNLLEDGLKTHQIRPQDIQQVILTGGSSQWLFVREIVRDLLRIEDSRIFQSANPNATIGTGLAVCPAATQGFRKKAQDLRNAMPRFISSRVFPALDEYAKGSHPFPHALVARHCLLGRAEDVEEPEDLRDRQPPVCRVPLPNHAP